MFSPLISIIIPVYKVEKYLRKCVDSVLAQTYGSIEVILVDDGSPDSCPAICDEYALKDKRVVVIHQANAGVSAARNAGLDVAKGDYISFVDDDDWIEPDMYEVLYDVLMMSGADFSASFSCFGNKDVVKVSPGQYVTFTPKQAMFYLLNCKCDLTSVWGKLFARNLIDSVRFSLKVAMGEDTLFTVEAIARSNKVAYINYQSYHYIARPDSVTHEFRENYWTNLNAIDMIVDIVRRLDRKLGEYAANHAMHLDIYISKVAESKGKFTKEAYRKILAHLRKYRNRDSWRTLSFRGKCWCGLLFLGRRPFVAGRQFVRLVNHLKFLVVGTG